MNRSRLGAGLILAVLLFASCGLERVDRAPEIRGQVTREGLPVKGVPLRLAVDAKPGCPSPARTIVTDGAGRFEMDAVERWAWSWPLGSRPRRAAEWVLCARVDATGGWRTVYHYLGGAYFPSPVECTIELNRPAVPSACSEARTSPGGSRDKPSRREP